MAIEYLVVTRDERKADIGCIAEQLKRCYVGSIIIGTAGMKYIVPFADYFRITDTGIGAQIKPQVDLLKYTFAVVRPGIKGSELYNVNVIVFKNPKNPIGNYFRKEEGYEIKPLKILNNIDLAEIFSDSPIRKEVTTKAAVVETNGKNLEDEIIEAEVVNNEAEDIKNSIKFIEPDSE